MADRDGIWIRDGVPVEELPDPFAFNPGPGGEAEAPVDQPRRRRRWPIYLYTISALLLVTLLWLIVTAPLFSVIP